MTRIIEDGAFDAWQHAQTADYRLLMAFRYGNRSDLIAARDHLALAVEAADAALAASPDTADKLALLLAGPLFAPHSPTPRA